MGRARIRATHVTYRSYRRGELQRVAASMPEDAECPWSELAQECIADLPAETV